jgi:glycosyltransferase involved in cell wall biosynthesis
MVRDAVRKVVRGARRASPGSLGELVFSGPLPPARTGVATYDRAVLDGLRRIGFFERHRMDVLSPIEPKDTPRLPGYRLGVFQLGNNVEFHLEAYRAAFLTQASLVVLHDLALDDFVRGLRTLGDPLGFMATREAARLRPNLRSPDVVRNEPLREPWCAHVARRARGIIVHSEFGKRYLEELGCRTPVFVVPHPVVESDVDMLRAADRGGELRVELEAGGMRLLIVAPGDLNEAKRLDALLAAASEMDDSVHVVLVGRRIEGYDVDRMVDTARLGGRVTLATDVSDDDFRGWIAAADVVVDLRFPHRGELSGSLMRAMQAGKPSIVSATGTYLDAPDDAVLRVAPGPTDAAELAGQIRVLLEDPELRARMGAAALDHIDVSGAAEATAKGYEQAIEETLRLVRDPAHKAMAIWGKALADLGADETDLREGLGVDYARALSTFRGTS